MNKNDSVQRERVYRQAMSFESGISYLPPTGVQCLVLIMLGLPPKTTRPEAARAIRKELNRDVF